MTKFLATHPLIAGSLLYFAGFCALVAIGLAAFAALRPIPGVMVGGWWALCLGGPPAVATGLTCVRRRCGLGTRSLWLLPLTLPAQTFILHWRLASAMALPFLSPDGPTGWGDYWDWVLSLLRHWQWYDETLFSLGGLIFSSGPAVLGGILAALGIRIGEAVARLMLRTGRWEHIVPVEKPKP